jgi:hypothetical protein
MDNILDQSPVELPKISSSEKIILRVHSLEEYKSIAKELEASFNIVPTYKLRMCLSNIESVSSTVKYIIYMPHFGSYSYSPIYMPENKKPYWHITNSREQFHETIYQILEDKNVEFLYNTKKEQTNMISAKEANKRSTEFITNEVSKELEIINKLILDASKNGKFNINSNKLKPGTIRSLEVLGYNITSQNHSNIIISWENKQ